jgi:hypothetical protein
MNILSPWFSLSFTFTLYSTKKNKTRIPMAPVKKFRPARAKKTARLKAGCFLFSFPESKNASGHTIGGLIPAVILEKSPPPGTHPHKRRNRYIYPGRLSIYRLQKSHLLGTRVGTRRTLYIHP